MTGCHNTSGLFNRHPFSQDALANAPQPPTPISIQRVVSSKFSHWRYELYVADLAMPRRECHKNRLGLTSYQTELHGKQGWNMAKPNPLDMGFLDEIFDQYATTSGVLWMDTTAGQIAASQSYMLRLRHQRRSFPSGKHTIHLLSIHLLPCFAGL